MIRWFTSNGVAANLLAAIVIVAGLFTAKSIKLELFPELDLGVVNVRVAYPGAAPEEVETSLTLTGSVADKQLVLGIYRGLTSLTGDSTSGDIHAL